MKKEIIILLIVIAALSGYLVLRKTDHTNYEVPELEKLAAADVDRMEIKEGETLLLFEKKEGDWAVDIEGFPGKKEEIEREVKVASELALTTLVSESKSYGRYNLDDSKGKKVSLFQGETLLRSFSVGKAAPSSQHTFVVVGDDTNVYHARGNLSNQFVTIADRYIDKKVFDMELQEINGISVTLDGKTVAAKRSTQQTGEGDAATTQTTWVDETGAPLGKSKVDNLVATLSTLTCDSWLAPTGQSTPEEAIITIVTDRPHTLTLFEATENEEGEEQTAKASDKSFSFKLSTATWNNLKNGMDAMLQNEKG